MDSLLYPIKFRPVLKEKVWGGNRLKSRLNKKHTGGKKIGESWEISAVKGNVSVISNGFLKGNNLQEIIEIYMGDLVGDKVFRQFGIEFPLLIKFIDAGENLSVQVHPGDDLAFKRHKAYGKTEMWYLLEALEGSQIVTGFNREMTKELLIQSLDSGNVTDVLNFENAYEGDVFFIPAGRVHATGGGILLAEIQQTSDITYRIFDWNRLDDGVPRKLHVELALDAIDYHHYDSYRTGYKLTSGKSSNVVNCPYFTTNILESENPVSLNYEDIDSFVILMGVKGSFIIEFKGTKEKLMMGETVLIPANIDHLKLIPSGMSRLLEIYVP
ncbi:MAG: mannose-6-phosphate isomerase [Bacteroidia bacterium]|nr:mannose-6-phosphate isomerase [Bacteroidia bacterium]